MIKLPITDEVLNSFYQIVKSKSTYLGFLINNCKLCVYSELAEIYYMSICHTTCVDTLSLRLPVEAMRVVMNLGYLIIDKIEYANGSVGESIQSYDSNGAMLCSVEIASEYSDTEDQVKDFIKAIVENKNVITVDDTSIFKRAIGLVKADSKEVSIKGVTFNSGKIFTIAGGFVAYQDDPYGLSMVLSTSTLKELHTFCSGKPEVRILRNGGFNICYYGSNIMAWKRVRLEKFIDMPDVEYYLSVDIPTFYLSKAFRFINTTVTDCFINLSEACLEINSMVGRYSIPLFIDKIPDIKPIGISYKLLSKLLYNVEGMVRLEVSKYNVHLIIDNTHYFIGVRYND